MTFKRSSSMMLVGATALAALAACVPAQNTAPQSVAAQAVTNADVPISDQHKAEIQAGLNKLGYDAGMVDGFIGRQSRDAIRAFQADIGATADGFYSPALLERVRAEAGVVAITTKPEAVQAPTPAAPKPVVKTAPAAPKPAVVAAPAVQPVVAPAPAPAPAPTTVIISGGGDGGGDGGGGGGGGDGGGGW